MCNLALPLHIWYTWIAGNQMTFRGGSVYPAMKIYYCNLHLSDLSKKYSITIYLFYRSNLVTKKLIFAYITSRRPFICFRRKWLSIEVRILLLAYTAWGKENMIWHCRSVDEKRGLSITERDNYMRFWSIYLKMCNTGNIQYKRTLIIAGSSLTCIHDVPLAIQPRNFCNSRRASEYFSSLSIL